MMGDNKSHFDLDSVMEDSSSQVSYDGIVSEKVDYLEDILAIRNSVFEQLRERELLKQSLLRQQQDHKVLLQSLKMDLSVKYRELQAITKSTRRKSCERKIHQYIASEKKEMELKMRATNMLELHDRLTKKLSLIERHNETLKSDMLGEFKATRNQVNSEIDRKDNLSNKFDRLKKDHDILLKSLEETRSKNNELANVLNELVVSEQVRQVPNF